MKELDRYIRQEEHYPFRGWIVTSARMGQDPLQELDRYIRQDGT